MQVSVQAALPMDSGFAGAAFVVGSTYKRSAVRVWSLLKLLKAVAIE